MCEVIPDPDANPALLNQLAVGHLLLRLQIFRQKQSCIHTPGQRTARGKPSFTPMPAMPPCPQAQRTPAMIVSRCPGNRSRRLLARYPPQKRTTIISFPRWRRLNFSHNESAMRPTNPLTCVRLGMTKLSPQPYADVDGDQEMKTPSMPNLQIPGEHAPEHRPRAARTLNKTFKSRQREARSTLTLRRRK